VSVLVWLDHINIVQHGHLFLVSPHTGLHGESCLPPNLHILGPLFTLLKAPGDSL
jgi:hypothetical protein